MELKGNYLLAKEARDLSRGYYLTHTSKFLEEVDELVIEASKKGERKLKLEKDDFCDLDGKNLVTRGFSVRVDDAIKDVDVNGATIGYVVKLIEISW